MKNNAYGSGGNGYVKPAMNNGGGGGGSSKKMPGGCCGTKFTSTMPTAQSPPTSSTPIAQRKQMGGIS